MMPEAYRKMRETQKQRQRRFVYIMIAIAIFLFLALWFSKDSHQENMWRNTQQSIESQ